VICSGRDDICKSVLNDEWVSHPSWSGDDAGGGGFVPHKKNAYEEAPHRSEEERHEYDFHIEALMRTIAMLEPINNKIQLLAPDEHVNFQLKLNLGGSAKSVHQRVIKKVHGREAGFEVVAAMAIPVVLAQLKGKEEEWPTGHVGHGPPRALQAYLPAQHHSVSSRLVPSLVSSYPIASHVPWSSSLHLGLSLLRPPPSMPPTSAVRCLMAVCAQRSLLAQLMSRTSKTRCVTMQPRIILFSILSGLNKSN
jgi:hypothetical protein